jgi:hypothetical protein
LAIKTNENRWLNVRSPLNPSPDAQQLLLKNAL